MGNIVFLDLSGGLHGPREGASLDQGIDGGALVSDALHHFAERDQAHGLRSASVAAVIKGASFCV
jgi:hypothetical protein